jgi:hypothetical protein
MFHENCLTECVFDKDRKLFLECFPGIKTFQTFPDSKKNISFEQKKYLTRQVSISENQYPGEKIDRTQSLMSISILQGLEKLNDRGSGIFLNICETNGKSRRTEDITHVRSVFADFDGTPLPGLFDEYPSMIVESSKQKYHVYWLVDDFPLESFTIIQESIANKFKSDPNVKDLSRVMRVPGFFHRKDKPFLTRILEYTGKIYSYRDIVEMFPPIPAKQWSAAKYQTPKCYTNFSRTYGTSKGNRNNYIASRVGGMIKRGLDWNTIVEEAYKEALACNPSLSQSETDLILKSLSRHVR